MRLKKRNLSGNFQEFLEFQDWQFYFFIDMSNYSLTFLRAWVSRKRFCYFVLANRVYE